jgi:dihydroflavonol-4-reductase
VILVTGATGFLGRNLCPYLAEQGHSLRALVRDSSQTGFLRRLGVELVCGDVRDAVAVQHAVQGCSKVIHAAGKFRFWGAPESFWSVNATGTHNVVNAAVRSGVERFIYVSTLAVVGRPDSNQLLDEQVHCYPQDAYQNSKLEAERLVLTAWEESGLPAIVLRPGAFYGPWGRYAFNRLFFEDPLRGLPLGVQGGRRITFPVFICDLVRTIAATLTRGRAGQIYNVAGPSLSHASVHAIISREAGICSRRINPPARLLIWLASAWSWIAAFTGREPYYPINMAPYVFCDWNTTSRKAEQELGFVATPFEVGARLTLAWYRRQRIGPTNRLGRLVLRMWRLCGDGAEAAD